MNKNEVKDFIYKHFKDKDVGIGVLNCIHDDKTVDELAGNLVDLFSIPFVRLSLFNEVYDKFEECEDDSEFTQYLNENTNEA